MIVRESARQIDAAATAWAVRIEGEALDAEAEAALEAWLAGDRRRAGALLRAQAALSLLDRGRALPKPDREHEARWARLSRRGLIAAGVLAAVGAAGAGAFLGMRESPREYQTALGEIRRVPLADGSLAAINTETRIDVVVTREVRQVKLDRGEAWFKVAHDVERPFVVEARQVRVRAVGTAFSVRALPNGVDVAVTEGAVETWTVGAEQRKTRIAAGARAFVSAEAPVLAMAAPVEIDRKLAWRQGQIALDGESLAAAAAEFNRYNARKIVVDDPVLAAEGLVGFFNTNEPEAFARAAAATLDAMVVVEGDTIRLRR